MKLREKLAKNWVHIMLGILIGVGLKPYLFPVGLPTFSDMGIWAYLSLIGLAILFAIFVFFALGGDKNRVKSA